MDTTFLRAVLVVTLAAPLLAQSTYNIPAGGVVTSETGTSSTFTIVLNTMPTVDVVFNVRSTDPGEGVINVNQVVFTPANFNVPQDIVVTGVQDAVDDGGVAFNIQFDAAITTDATYNGYKPSDVPATNTDDDVAGVTVTPTTITTTEAGGTATYTLVLNTQPVADVVINVVSSDTTEGTVTPASITFSAGVTGGGANHWSNPQTVTVTGVDDLLGDGDIAYTVTNSNPVTADAAYAAVTVADVSATNTDDDTPGVSVTPTTGLTTTEQGGTTAFSVVLNTQPTANVVITVTSNDLTEGTVSPATLTFTTATWPTAQLVTVAGVQDSVQDGSVVYTVSTVTTSTDMGYDGVNPTTVTLTNTDDDTAGVTVTPTSGLVTTEGGGTASFAVVINSEPVNDVTIDMTVSDATEGSITPAQLVFTATNWNTARNVAVRGVDDSVQDGDIPFTVMTQPATGDASYVGIDAADVTVVNTDDDVAGMTLTPNTGLTTTEAGGTQVFSVTLNSEPTADVVINLQSGDLTEATVSPAQLTFTSANWNTAQQVTTTGENDFIDDGDIGFTIIATIGSTIDAQYQVVAPSTVTGTNLDDDVAAINVSPTTGLVTTEVGGTATFTVSLATEPTSNVQILLSSDDASEGTTSTSSITFTPSTWGNVITVTVTGEQDAIDDDDITYNILIQPAVSADANYNGLNTVPQVSLTNTDDDTAGVTILPTSGLVVTEAGGTATFTVALHTQPMADVFITLSSGDTTEGTISTSLVTFTPGASTPGANHWSSPNTITVTGVDDSVADGDQAFNIITATITSTDAKYSAINPPDVGVTCTDDDTAGVLITVAAGLTTRELGSNATYSVRLQSEPTADVTITIVSNDTTEATVSPTTLTFTAADWATPVLVTITGVDDFVCDGSVLYLVEHTAVSTDTSYNRISIVDVEGTNLDDDSVGVAVSTATMTTTEAGGVDSFTVWLLSEPVDDVSITFATNDTTEATAPTTPTVFTSANWNIPATVIVTGVDDNHDDGSVPFLVRFNALVSNDAKYSGLAPLDTVSGVNTDDDTAGLTVINSSMVTTEAGTSVTFTVQLQTIPLADVTVAISSGDHTEGTVAPTSLVFTALTWNTPQQVTVTGVDDFIDDGDVTYNIFIGPPTSSDVAYTVLAPSILSCQNQDDDSKAVTVSPVFVTTTETGGTDTFTIALGSQPTDDVIVTLANTNTQEASLSQSSVTFTAGSWDAVRTITVTGVQDPVDDGDVRFLVITSVVSTDPVYNQANAADVEVTNTDDDTASIDVDLTALTTSENGQTATFSVVLKTQPTADVMLDMTSSDATEGTVTSTLTFSSGGANQWSVPQTATVTGVDDSVADGDIPYNIIFGTATSSDANYAAITPVGPAVVNLDNDVAGLTVAPASGVWNTIVDESGTSTYFTMVLDTEPVADVTVTLTLNNTAEGTLLPATLTYTPSTWSTTQTITVTGLDDFVADGDVTFAASSLASGSDPVYAGLSAADVLIINRDNDVVGIAISDRNLTTTEAGGADTFTVQLTSQPTFDVVIPLALGNSNEGSLSTASVTITPLAWNTPNVVTVTGIDDDVVDGTVTYPITVGPATSTDPLYSGMTSPGIAVHNTDNDVAGVAVSAPSQDTTEAGGNGTFTVTLQSEPTADVTLQMSSGDNTEGTVTPAALIFSPANWAVAQTVTVTGVDDSIHDGDVQYSIVTELATSTDPVYHGIDPPNPRLFNSDDDAVGVIIADSSGLPITTLTTREDGTADVFTVKLNSEPLSDVTLDLIGRDQSEGLVDTTSITFTAGNWDVAHSVTVTGVQDAIADGDVQYAVSILLRTSDTTGYAGMAIPDVMVTNVDDDAVGVSVNPTAGLVTNENGASDVFTIVLHTQPTADVTIDITSANPDEGVASPSQLVFLPSGCSSGCTSGRAHWSSPQTVTVTGVDDVSDDDDQAYTIVLSAVVSTDAGYSGFKPADVAVVNVDDDQAAILVEPANPFFNQNTGESMANGNLEFLVRLSSQPTDDVLVNITSNDTSEGVVSPDMMVFTPMGWNTTQVATISGVNDDVVDGDTVYAIMCASSSLDQSYAGAVSQDINVLNIDDDVASVVITAAANLFTTEQGGTASFTVELSSEPVGDVVLTLESSNMNEGIITPLVIRFNASVWAQPVTVTVSGVDDQVSDGNVSYSVRVVSIQTNDANYANQVVPEVAMYNSDDDTPAVLVTPTSGLVTNEAGNTTASFTIVLQTEPTADVSIPMVSGDPTEGMVSPTVALFTPANWSVPQVVTVTGVNDDVDDGDVVYNVLTNQPVSADGRYAQLPGSRVEVTNTDDDDSRATVCVLPGVCSCCAATTTEAGGAAEFTVVLSTQPLSDVMIDVYSTDTSEGVVSVSTLTFTSGSWNAPRTVTVTGVQDAIDDGDVDYSIVLSPAMSSDPNFAGLDLLDMVMTNTDDDTRGVTVTPVTMLLNETGAPGTFSVVLHTQPTGDVTVAVESTDSTEAVINTAELIFTSAIAGGNNNGRTHWSTPQTVTVTPVNDDVDDGDITSRIVVHPASSTDPVYDGLKGDDVEVTTLDDDTAGITVTPTGSLYTSQEGGTAVFTVVLDSSPTAPVVVDVTSNNTVEGAVSPVELTFTDATWRTPQTVTVTGQQDSTSTPDDTPYSVALAMRAGSDPLYNLASLPTVQMINRLGTATLSPGTTASPTAVPGTGTCNYGLVAPAGATGCPTTGLAAAGTSCTYVVSGNTCTSVVCLATGLWSGAPVCGAVSGCAAFATSCTVLAAPPACGATCTAAACCSACSSYGCPSGKTTTSLLCGATGCDENTCCTLAGDSGDDDIPNWAVALIIAGALLCCGLCLLLGFLLWRKGGKEKKETTHHRQETYGERERYSDEHLYSTKAAPTAYDSPPHRESPPRREKTVAVPDDGGERFIARWSNTKGRYYYYPEGAGSEVAAIWELPPDAMVVMWKGGPEEGQDLAEEDRVHRSVMPPKDPYTVTPLPTSGRNPLETFSSPQYG